jgi:hypothetical protein
MNLHLQSPLLRLRNLFATRIHKMTRPFACPVLRLSIPSANLNKAANVGMVAKCAGWLTVLLHQALVLLLLLLQPILLLLLLLFHLHMVLRLNALLIILIVHLKDSLDVALVFAPREEIKSVLLPKLMIHAQQQSWCQYCIINCK